MSLETAWLILGEDPRRVMAAVASLGTRQEKVKAAEDALEEAKRVAKKIMGVHHPDKNPGDEKAARRYRRVQEAIETLSYHTSLLRKVSDEIDEKIQGGTSRLY